MTREAFERQMDRMVEQFGEKHYSAERRKLIFQAVKEISGDAFEKICDDLIADSLYAPTRSKFVEAVSRLAGGNYAASRDEEARIRHLRETTARCRYCGNRGYIQAWNREQPVYSASFNCSCPIAKAMGQAGPAWDDSWLAKYNPDFDGVDVIPDPQSGAWIVQPKIEEPFDRTMAIAQIKAALSRMSSPAMPVIDPRERARLVEMRRREIEDRRAEAAERAAIQSEGGSIPW